MCSVGYGEYVYMARLIKNEDAGYVSLRLHLKVKTVLSVSGICLLPDGNVYSGLTVFLASS